jgi:hypothetical protein
MSSPIDQTSDPDGAWRYAPPRVRAELQWVASCSELAANEPQTWSGQPWSGQPWNGDDNCDDLAAGRAAALLQRLKSLDPEFVPEPLPDLEDEPAAKRVPLWSWGAATVAAVLAAIIVAVPAQSPKQDNLRANSALVAVASKANSWERTRAVATIRIERRDNNTGGGTALTPLPGERTRPRLPAAASAAADAPTTQQVPSPTGQQSPVGPGVPGLVIRHLEPDEVRNLVSRGAAFIASGDIAAARLVLRRAAEGGDVGAALALAGTFDPNLLARRGRPELADAAQARLWYQRAKQFGSAEAPQRLEQLATHFDTAN